ncbi:LOW QUALITY PROTEIN: AP-5 complex subunit sigma-1 [Melopsittacus undulatus]|uniref:LOW QUALITY PROTEIN: AP-5 complex subunit sigma-1 n=1 Tax=Melopsittacus undulatus TaxID=13146 RepID=UPI001469BF40|nr:LOW QUALITY PROTEIN: AP-5 complex subunit sigma-1 [Melopsittacus undulatus]
MVRALVLLALGGQGPAGHAPCRVLCARSFGTPPPPPTGTPPPEDPPRERLRRQEQIAAVARQVATQCHLLSSSAPIPTDPISFHHSPYGVFQLPPGDPFPEPVTVTWIQVMTLALALVCEPHENLALAELTLRRLAPRFLASLRLLDPGSNALLHPDAADGVLERLLPHGEMLFLNEGFIQGMDREMGIKRSR